MKILILSCSTGEGHNSAAKAIAESLRLKDIDCDICDVLTFKSVKASRRAANLYSTVIKKTPALFGVVYTLGKVYDNLRLPSPIYSANAKYADKLYSFINQNGFDCVICTHLFAMLAMTEAKRKYGLSSLKCYGVMTDYTIHPFIKDSDLDGYFVPNETVAGQFVKKGFQRDKLFETGIPVHPEFNLQISKQDARISLNLPPDKKIIVIMSGGAGCGKIIKLSKRADKAFDESHLFLVFTGRNDKLKKKLDGIFKDNVKFRTVAFTPDVHLYLKAADCVLSKSGGLSSTEIAVTNVPLVHLKAIPGLEMANLKYFSGNGLSLRADTVKKAVENTVKLLNDDGYCKIICKLQKLTVTADATEKIVKKITERIKYDGIFMAAVYNGRFYFGERDVLQDNPEKVGA